MVEVVREMDEKHTQRVISTRWVVVGVFVVVERVETHQQSLVGRGGRHRKETVQGRMGRVSKAEGRETHPMCRIDTLGGRGG